jgi:hypothetical protein
LRNMELWLKGMGTGAERKQPKWTRNTAALSAMVCNLWKLKNYKIVFGSYSVIEKMELTRIKIYLIKNIKLKYKNKFVFKIILKWIFVYPK